MSKFDAHKFVADLANYSLAHSEESIGERSWPHAFGTMQGFFMYQLEFLNLTEEQVQSLEHGLAGMKKAFDKAKV